jgi:hypothetical protein
MLALVSVRIHEMVNVSFGFSTNLLLLPTNQTFKQTHSNLGLKILANRATFRFAMKCLNFSRSCQKENFSQWTNISRQFSSEVS